MGTKVVRDTESMSADVIVHSYTLNRDTARDQSFSCTLIPRITLDWSRYEYDFDPLPSNVGRMELMWERDDRRPVLYVSNPEKVGLGIRKGTFVGRIIKKPRAGMVNSGT